MAGAAGMLRQKDKRETEGKNAAVLQVQLEYHRKTGVKHLKFGGR
jgi:hypothetical protein